ncbi:MAG TPA: hypothetical protein VKA09_15060 [Nitrososphaeraceae archaeon]|nr:hypothetical protein [Nitrososphaeraceae archaeon]
MYVAETRGDRERYERKLKRGCRIVTREVPLIGVKPDRIDYPFFLMYLPFKYAEEDWAGSILQTNNATSQKLYKELRRQPWS